MILEEEVQEELTEETLSLDLEEGEESVEEVKQKLDHTLAELRDQKIQLELHKTAIKKGITNLDKVLPILNTSTITINAEGQVEGVDELLDVFLEVAPKKKFPETIGDSSNPQVVDRANEQRLKEAADKARKTGRVEDRAAFSTLKQKLFGGK